MDYLQVSTSQANATDMLWMLDGKLNPLEARLSNFLTYPGLKRSEIIFF